MNDLGAAKETALLPTNPAGKIRDDGRPGGRKLNQGAAGCMAKTT